MVAEGLAPLAVSVTEAAKLLNVSRPTLYRYIGQDGFPSFKLGGRVLVNVAGLQAWIDQQTKEGERA